MSRGAAEPAGTPVGGQAGVGCAFISYVREDARRVDELQRALEAAGIPVWRDTADLWPGEDWRAKIRRAITDDALVFIACFSWASVRRDTSYQNEELTLAVEQLRLRQPENPWLIPVRLDECTIPDRDIGAGRTLASIQRVDLFDDRSGAELARLVTAVSRMLGSTSHPSHGRPRQRVVAAVLRKATVAFVIAVVLLGILVYVLLHIVYDQSGLTVTGSVTCESGRPVVGVWIAASTGQSGSGYAHLGPPGTSGISYPIGATGTYSYRLPHGGTYAVHVGCGGTAQHWASSNYSPLLSSPTAHLECADPTSLTQGSSPKGSCVVIAS
jgi:hypothetical protein